MMAGSSMDARTSEKEQRAFSIQEFSKAYGIGRTKIYEELNSGRLRGRKIGRRTLIAKLDAEDWLQRLPTVSEASA
jgi:excisionase family DNA binding protein